MKFIINTLREAARTPGFSLLYICGVAFTIAFTMIYGMLLYAQLGPVYPEYNRNSTIYINRSLFIRDNGIMGTSLDRSFIERFLRDSLKSAEKMTAMVGYNSGYPMVQTDGHGPEFHVETRFVEPSFFDFYSYEFKAGKPFTESDFNSKLRVAAVSDKVARRLFSTPEEAVGGKIRIDHVDYRICGVFREGSALCPDSYGEVFIPYSTEIGFSNNNSSPEQYGGSLKAIIKTKPGQEKEIRRELNDICRRINAIDTAAPKMYLPDMPTHAEHVLLDRKINYGKSCYGNEYAVMESASLLTMCRPLIIGLLVLLLIPALNISGLIGARMDRLNADLAVRRCFGATRGRIMRMVMNENLVLTLTGGILGLVAAWLIATFAGDTLLMLSPVGYGSGISFGSDASFLTGEMAFSPILFAATLILCIILNILSAWLPAHRAMRRQITESLNSKR